MPKILRATVGAGLPAPRFFDQAITFTAIITRPSSLATTQSAIPGQRPSKAGASDISPAERKVFEALGRGAASVDDLADRLKISPAGVRRHLRRLLSLGVISRHGGAGHKDTTYSPYTLTPEGDHLRLRFFTAGGTLAAERWCQTEDQARAAITEFMRTGELQPSITDE